MKPQPIRYDIAVKALREILSIYDDFNWGWDKTARQMRVAALNALRDMGETDDN